MQEVDFRQAYQRMSFTPHSTHSPAAQNASRSGLFFPLDVTEAVYPVERANAVYHTLDMMPLFWQEASTAHEHLLTTYV